MLSVLTKTKSDPRKPWEVLDMFITLIVVTVPWILAYVQTYQTVQ